MPDYPTQDELYDEVSGDSDACSVSIELTCEIETMTVGDCLEVYWEGEGKWFEGEVAQVDMEDKTFQILYR